MAGTHVDYKIQAVVGNIAHVSLYEGAFVVDEDGATTRQYGRNTLLQNKRLVFRTPVSRAQVVDYMNDYLNDYLNDADARTKLPSQVRRRAPRRKPTRTEDR